MKHPDIHDFLNYSGATIVQLCKLKGISQEKLAELAGLSPCQISRIINASPDSKASSIKGIAYALGILRRPSQDN